MATNSGDRPGVIQDGYFSGSHLEGLEGAVDDAKSAIATSKSLAN
jgi:hypothetical protein